MKELTLDTVAHFTWDFGMNFFLETEECGNFIWSDPDYLGTNTIVRTNLTYKQWIGKSFGRDKGKHKIEDYCGKDVIIF